MKWDDVKDIAEQVACRSASRGGLDYGDLMFAMRGAFLKRLADKEGDPEEMRRHARAVLICAARDLYRAEHHTRIKSGDCSGEFPTTTDQTPLSLLIQSESMDWISRLSDEAKELVTCLLHSPKEVFGILDEDCGFVAQRKFHRALREKHSGFHARRLVLEIKKCYST